MLRKFLMDLPRESRSKMLKTKLNNREKPERVLMISPRRSKEN